MKNKILVAFLMLCFSISSVYAIKPDFEWNKALTGSVGYWKIHSPYATDAFGMQMPTNLIGFDVHILGVYFGGGYMCKKTGYEVYGYDERIETFIFKLGPSWRLFWFLNQFKLCFTPYILWSRCSVDDVSGNAIGQRQDYGPIKDVFGGGLKVTFAYKYFEIGISASNRDFGVNIGANLDF